MSKEQEREPFTSPQSEDIATSIVELVEREGISIVNAVHHKHTVEPEIIVVLDSPLLSRFPNSGQSDADEFRRLLAIFGAARHKYDFEEYPSSINTVSVTDINPERLEELIEGTEKIEVAKAA